MNCVAYPICSFSPALGSMSGKSFKEIGAASSGTFASGRGCDFGFASLVTVGFPVVPWFTCARAAPASISASAATPNLNPIFPARYLTSPAPYAVLAQNYSPKYSSFPRYAQREHPVPCAGGYLRRSFINEIFYKTFGHQNRKPRRTLIAN